ncbi:MAG: NAD(P)/FAD-dependent oxidoreductase [Nanoarchaeota archaeon]|nr:NAD(P)/FAD-dependent oxidoreductase [Nanoarchaeota archaeon]
MASIIGAGPVGNYLAGKLAKNGLKVEVYEEHKKIGEPIACTGILTSYLGDFMKVNEDYVINKVNQTNVYSPNGNFVNIKLKKNYIVNRDLFDRHLAEDAKSNGAKYNLGFRFNSLKNKSMKFDNGEIRKDDCIIGADGPKSLVGRSAGIFGERKFVVGHQARVRLKNKTDPDIVEFFLDEGNYIGWSVPEDEKTVRLGVASHKGVKNHFEILMKKRPGKILNWQSGPIPVYNPSLKYESDGVYLIGDAATQVKATTYGGIIPGMHAADLLAKVITNETEGGYQKGLWKATGRHLWMHLMIRKVMNRFRKEDYNELIRLCEKNSVRDTIYEYDREYPLRLLFALGLKQPNFFKFSKCLLRNEI